MPDFSATPVQPFSLQVHLAYIDRENPDKYMPTSTTCYFTLGLPQYSSYEILNEKLKYAIHNCNSIDADFVPDDNEELLSEII